MDIVNVMDDFIDRSKMPEEHEYEEEDIEVEDVDDEDDDSDSVDDDDDLVYSDEDLRAMVVVLCNMRHFSFSYKT